MDGIVHIYWPLWAIYPAAALFFSPLSILILPPVCRYLMPERYTAFNTFNEMCWRQNICSGVHTSLAVVMLVAVVATDDDLFVDRLNPHQNMW